MTDFLYMMSQAKLAQYYDTRTDLPIRKYVLIANILRNSNIHEEDKTEDQWLDTILGALDQQEEEMYDDDTKNQAITIRHYTFTSKDRQQNQALKSNHQNQASKSDQQNQALKSNQQDASGVVQQIIFKCRL